MKVWGTKRNYIGKVMKIWEICNKFWNFPEISSNLSWNTIHIYWKFPQNSCKHFYGVSKYFPKFILLISEFLQNTHKIYIKFFSNSSKKINPYFYEKYLYNFRKISSKVWFIFFGSYQRFLKLMRICSTNSA